MNNIWNYLLVGVLVFVLIFAIALPFLGRAWAPYGMGSWLGGHGMTDGCREHGGFGMFGSFMMLGAVLLPLLFIGVVIVGVIALFRGRGGFATSIGVHSCPNCGKNVEADWVACPSCGQGL